MGRSVASATNGFLTSQATGNNSHVTVTARDTFSKGDPVFLDYQNGNAVNLNNGSSLLNAAAGMGFDPLVHPAQYGTAGASTAAATFSDGSYVLISLTHASTTDTNSRLNLYKYDKQGILLCDTTIYTGSDPYYNLMVDVTPSNGLFVVYRQSGNQPAYIIFDNGLAVLFSGQVTAAGTNPIAIKCMTDGGALVATDLGVYRVTGAGVTSQPISVTVTWIGEDSTNGDLPDGRLNDCTWINSAPHGFHKQGFFSISSSGWGILIGIATGASYYQFNGDGTVRGTTTTLVSALTGGSKTISAKGVSGNIFWGFAHNGGVTWGIVSDSGTVVKASTLIASSDAATVGFATNYLQVIPDANGDFFFTWSSGTLTALNQTYVVGSSGTAKGGFPRSDAVSMNSPPRLFRLTTGIVCFFSPTAATSYSLNFHFFLNAGTLSVNSKALGLKDAAGPHATNTLAAYVFNDSLYLAFLSTATLVRDPSGLVGKISNAGVVLINRRIYTSTNTVSYPMMYVDANDIIILNGFVMKRLRTSDLVELGTQGTINLALGSYSSFVAQFRMVKAGVTWISTLGAVRFDSDATNSWNTGLIRVKLEKTILIGAAAADCAAGGQLKVQTKGSVSCPSWANVYLSGDHTGVVPAGNKFSFAGGVLSLGGVL